MREIKFRGKNKSNSWIYGSLIIDDIKNEFYISHSLELFSEEKTKTKKTCQIFEEVLKETVGQFTGLTDTNEKEIYEGDIMSLCKSTYPCKVYYDGKSFVWMQKGRRREIDLSCEKMAIIGNIHDNPELLKGNE